MISSLFGRAVTYRDQISSADSIAPVSEGVLLLRQFAPADRQLKVCQSTQSAPVVCIRSVDVESFDHDIFRRTHMLMISAICKTKSYHNRSGRIDNDNRKKSFRADQVHAFAWSSSGQAWWPFMYHILLVPDSVFKSPKFKSKKVKRYFPSLHVLW